MTKLDRLARSLPDARDILDELTKRNVKLSLGGSIHDPTDPVGRLLFNVLGVGRSTIYRTLGRMRPVPPEPERPFARLANPQTTGRA